MVKSFGNLFPGTKGDYFKYCGQKFWEFISGNSVLYTDIIEPLGHKAKERNNDFIKAYSKRINKFTLEFGEQFCNYDGDINWENLVKFNSSIDNPQRNKKKT